MSRELINEHVLVVSTKHSVKAAKGFNYFVYIPLVAKTAKLCCLVCTLR